MLRGAAGRELISLWVLLLSAGTLTGTAAQEPQADPASTLSCHLREYTFEADLSLPGLPCRGEITTTACWGRCHTSQVGDHAFPYLLSEHPTCAHTDYQLRSVPLPACHPFHPQPIYFYPEALECGCVTCDDRHTSCEGL